MPQPFNGTEFVHYSVIFLIVQSNVFHQFLSCPYDLEINFSCYINVMCINNAMLYYKWQSILYLNDLRLLFV